MSARELWLGIRKTDRGSRGGRLRYFFSRGRPSVKNDSNRYKGCVMVAYEVENVPSARIGRNSGLPASNSPYVHQRTGNILFHSNLAAPRILHHRTFLPNKKTATSTPEGSNDEKSKQKKWLISEHDASHLEHRKRRELIYSGPCSTARERKYKFLQNPRRGGNK